jgi:DNA segregation ATPase FtsK/SpoIIIE, S-DNA-T family
MKDDTSLILGASDTGETLSVELARAPHILVGGMTGAGKSSFIHGIISQLIELPTIDVGIGLIDPKRVEFSRYTGIPHLLSPKPIYEIKDIESFLHWCVTNMRARFDTMEKDGQKTVYAWSRLVIIIDELANLILASKRIEKPIVTLASMGRAAGIHLILATQRPSADVVTGLIRANVPTRVCLPVITKMDSRIILDEVGGERLEKPGEMLVRLPWQRGLIRGKAVRVSNTLIDDQVSRLQPHETAA